MSANRVIPYGYAVESGRNVPHPAESKIVRRVYADYMVGGSLKSIAEALTAEKIEFIPGRSDWNKNRVKRILEDKRYLGTDTYPVLIGEDMHRQAGARKDSNNHQQLKSEHPFRPSCPVECALCGAVMKRRRGVRHNVPHEVWTCQNPDCHAIIGMEDDALQNQLAELLNRLTADPGLVDTEAPRTAEPPEIRRMANETDRELDAFAFDKDKATQAIFTLASERYNHIDSRPFQGRVIIAAFEDSKLSPEPLSLFNPGLFKRTVLKIQLGEGITRLILKNHQTIERSVPSADSDHDNHTAGEPAAIPA
jgi:hypothetical protein